MSSDRPTVKCPNCGAALEPSDTCKFCGAAVVERQLTQQGPHASTLRVSRGMVATPTGLEALERACPACGSRCLDPSATTCVDCHADLPSLAASALARLARAGQAGFPTSADALGRMEQSMEQAGLSPELRDAMRRAGPLLQAGCPSCHGPLGLRTIRRGGRQAIKVRWRLGQRASGKQTPSTPPTPAASSLGGDTEVVISCTRCDYRAPVPPA